MSGRSSGAVACVALLLTLATAAKVGAQVSRDGLITSAVEAYDAFDSERALELLEAALDPELGPPDSVWAGAVQLLAQILLEDERENIASVWLRWAIRLEPSLEIDTLNYLRAVAAFRGARQAVGAGNPEDSVASWEWSAAGVDDSLGAVRVESTLEASVQVSVDGVPMLAAGQRLDLAPGSYQFQAEATGYFSAEVTREVLPGVTTVLEFNLSPIPVVVAVVDSVIPEDVLSASLRAVGRLTVHRFATDPSCGTGFLAGSGRMFVTTYKAIRGADSVEIDLPDGRRLTQDITVGAYDVPGNFAVLRLATSADDSLPFGGVPDDDQYAWALGNRGCEPSTPTRVQIAASDDPPAGLLTLRGSVTVGDGAPLISREGAVIGLVADPQRAVPIDRVAAAATQVRDADRRADTLTVAQVALRERHQFGAVALTTDIRGAVAQIEPLETWHWSGIERLGLLPATFAGPMGRYRIDLSSANAESYQTVFTINPRLLETLSVPPRPVAPTPTPQIAVSTGGGKFPWPIAALGVAAAGGAVALLAGGGGGGGNGPGTNGATTGGITIQIPNR